jgi:tripartite ATP-independent transporter DctP family solute receptor
MLSPGRSSFFFGLFVGVLLTAALTAGLLRNRLDQSDARSARPALKLSHPLPAVHPNHQASLELARLLPALSGSSLSVEVHGSAVLGTASQSIEQLQTGSLDLAVVSAAELESFSADFAVFGLPYVFRDRAHYWRALDGPVGDELLAGLASRRMLGLAYFDAGSRSFYTRTRPVSTPADLSGLKIRVMNSRAAMSLVEALGASPTPIAWGELYSALAQGTVDGAENNFPSYVSNRHYEVAPHFTVNQHTRIPDVLVVASSTWETLSPSAREQLRQAAKQASLFQRDLWKRTEDEARAAAVAAGADILDLADDAAFRARTSALREQTAGTRVGELLARIQAE